MLTRLTQTKADVSHIPRQKLLQIAQAPSVAVSSLHVKQTPPVAICASVESTGEASYEKLRNLVKEWIELGIEASKLKTEQAKK